MQHQLQTHERRINEHSKEIDDLKTARASSDVRIDSLCEKLEAQTKSINWLIGLILTTLLSFFFYAVQTGIFK